MAGNKIIFKDRVSTNVNRKKLTIIEPSNGTTMLVDVERADTSISELGTPLNAETMNNLLQVANVVDTLGTSTTDVMSQKSVTDNINIINKRDTASNWQSKNSTLKLGEFGYDTTNNIIKIGNGTSPWQNLSSFNSSQFTDATGAINYIGKNVSLTISNGVHILTNCTGAVTIDINANSFELYVYNSPKLTVNNKTSLNWRNIYINGVASYDLIKTNISYETPNYGNAVRLDVAPIEGDYGEITYDIGRKLSSFALNQISVVKFNTAYNQLEWNLFHNVAFNVGGFIVNSVIARPTLTKKEGYGLLEMYLLSSGGTVGVADDAVGVISISQITLKRYA